MFDRMTGNQKLAAIGFTIGVLSVILVLVVLR